MGTARGRREGDFDAPLDRLPGKKAFINDTIEQVRGNLKSLITDTSALSRAATEQASSVEETSASIEQMAASIRQTSENANVTDGIAGKAASAAAEGGSAVQQTVTARKQIAEKIAIIDEIAFQTNMLALNATIEAAG